MKMTNKAIGGGAPNTLEKLSEHLTKKQYETMCRWLDEKPRITMLSGGK